MKNGVCLLLVIFLASSLSLNQVLAHKPRIVQNNQISIQNPELSQAFYAELSGIPHIYVIESSVEYNLYVNLLVPKSSNPSGRYSAHIYRIEEDKKILLDSLDGGAGDWKEFYEEFAGDYYLQGPELKRGVPAGRYEIIVFNDGNKGKYALAVGEIEKFGPSDILSVFTVLPVLKKDFFEVSILTLLQAKLGIIFIAGILFPFVLLAILIMAAYRKMRNNS